MSDVNRDPIRWERSMTQDKDGQYVSYHDYAVLLDSHDRLRAELAGKEKALSAAKTVIEAKDKAYALIDQRFAAMAAKAATTDSERECNERMTAEIDALTAELAEARRMLDEARKQEPVAWRIQTEPSDFITRNKLIMDEYVEHNSANVTPLYAAPVPAQPAVPDDVARDAVEVVAYRIYYPDGAKRLTEDGEVYEHEKRAGLKIDWLGVVGGIDAAILSATEGRSNG